MILLSLTILPLSQPDASDLAPWPLKPLIFTICPFYADHGIIIDSVSGGVAQLVERGIHKPKVSGSSPDAASNRATLE